MVSTKKEYFKAMSTNDSLSTYKKKRDFNRSPEPQGNRTANNGSPRFVIQKHDATNLHYDFRLEIGGVLKSWVIPKGPSTDTSVKRLAIPTEDHPLDYIDFEGIIPAEEYGGGAVLVWDTGTYRNLKEEKQDDKMGPVSMEDSVEEGRVEVWLEGKKLKGGYALVEMKGRNGWLLIKMDDEGADARRNPVSTQPDSVLTGRSLEDIEADESV